MSKIPVIDLFAGPGGLGEGFSALEDSSGADTFGLRLSVEKDNYAHETLELRSFFRQFPKGNAPEEYYHLIKSDIRIPEEFSDKKEKLFQLYPDESSRAKKEAWQATLGEVPVSVLDKRITSEINGASSWVLIGGPPCQAYSLAGRVRNGGVNENDHRVYLYKEYLGIIARHQPPVFVMENVKGLLSAKVNGRGIFGMMLNDLQHPSGLFPDTGCPDYKVFSLSAKPAENVFSHQPLYNRKTDFLIECEKYGIPQKRHRVILLGIRQDINVTEIPVLEESEPVSLQDVIGDLPRLRSGLSRRILSQKKGRDGRLKFKYEILEDSFHNWRRIFNGLKKEILHSNGFTNKLNGTLQVSPSSRGGGFVLAKDPSKKPSKLASWYHDPRLEGVCNHESRGHLDDDLKRYFFASFFLKVHGRSPLLPDYPPSLLPKHKNAGSGKFVDRFRVQNPEQPATTVTSHISKDGHYFIHYDPNQCRSLTVREAARIQTFPDNYFFCGSRTAQYRQVGNAVPPYLAFQIAKIVKFVLK
ncbi:MAG: DNA cytosine methyltransferase [Lewinellaceae bacterium]|nr:DNA cytosine methyltransferase [Lewinellaceae bacterium]